MKGIQNFQGYWRVPPNAKELPGTLTITEGEIVLKLVGAFATSVFEREVAPKLLVGRTSNEAITLFNLINYRIQWGAIPASEYRFKFALKGVAAKTINDLAAREVHVTSARVNQWLTDLDGVESEYEDSWRIEVREMPDKVLMDTPAMSVLHTYALTSSEDTLHHNPAINRAGWFYIDTKRRKPFLEIMQRKEHLRYLLAFLLNEEVTFDRTELLLRMRPLVKVECFEARLGTENTDLASPLSPLILYDDIKTNWPQLVKAWFLDENRLNHFIRFYLEGIAIDSEPIRRFIAMARSLEAIHREWMAANNRVWSHFRPAMNACISYSKEISRRHFTVTNMAGYTKQLKEYRDAFSHGKNPYYRSKIDFRQVQWRSRELHEIVAACLFLKLGVPPTVLKQSLRRDALIRNWPRRNFKYVRYRR